MTGFEAGAFVARGLHDVALLTLFGSLAFRRFVLPRDEAAGAALIGVAGAWLALTFGVAWLTAVAGTIAGARGPEALAGAVPEVAVHTNFGRLVCLRLVLLIVVLALRSRRGPRRLDAALAVAGGAVALQPLLGHIGALEGSVRTVLIPIEIAHILAAGAWLGGLVSLLSCVARAPAAAAPRLCERFTPVGLVAVGTIAMTALPAAGEMIGGLPWLFGTQYGQLALLKLGLFVLALGLACVNRFVLTGRLGSALPRRVLIGAISVETIAVTGIVFAAAAMASSPPATHIVPVWPFPWRPSLGAWQDPASRAALIRLLAATTAGLVPIGVSVALRRQRFLAGGLAVLVVAPFLPSLGLLFVEAYPTSYARSATGFSVAAIAHGQELFSQRCVFCHDSQMRRGARGDLTAAHLWDHQDGELFWWVTNGITDSAGGPSMPAFGPLLSDNDRWALIDFIRARNIGMQAKYFGAWSPPVQAPAMPLNCDGGEAYSLADVGGHDLLIVAEDDPAAIVPVLLRPGSVPGTESIRVVRDGVAIPGEGECVAASTAAWEALRVLSGVGPDRFGGYQALVDGKGWVRAWLPPGADTKAILAAVRDANDNPVSTAARVVVGHQH